MNGAAEQTVDALARVRELVRETEAAKYPEREQRARHTEKQRKRDASEIVFGLLLLAAKARAILPARHRLFRRIVNAFRDALYGDDLARSGFAEVRALVPWAGFESEHRRLLETELARLTARRPSELN